MTYTILMVLGRRVVTMRTHLKGKGARQSAAKEARQWSKLYPSARLVVYGLRGNVEKPVVSYGPRVAA